MRCLVVAIVGVVMLANPARGQPASEWPAVLDGYLEGALRDWEVPGAAIAVVKDGKVVVAKGYGVLALGRPDKVDANTIFDAASLTKAFTAAMIATLVDAKAMAWDDPVHLHLPTLEFSDPYLTANVTIRDLLCHRTGIRNNSAWFFTALTRPQLLGVVKSIPPSAAFRTRVVYSNLGYAIAGEAAAAAGRAAWEELVTKRLLVPLGMTRTTASFLAAPALKNVATGHAMFGTAQRPTLREGTPRVTTAAAGAIQSSAADLATWMLFQLGDGTWHGRRIVSADAMNEMHSPQIASVSTEAFRASRQIHYFTGYGFGWQVFDYRGNKLLWHTGGGNGQYAYIALLPDQKLGIAILMNTAKAGGPLSGGLATRIMDHYLGLSTHDYAADYHAAWIKDQQHDADERAKLAAARQTGTTPSASLASFAGTYRDRLGLDVVVSVDGGQLQLRYAGGQPAALVHWHHDTFRLRWQDPLAAEQHGEFVAFAISGRGQVDELHTALFGEDIDARRVP